MSIVFIIFITNIISITLFEQYKYLLCILFIIMSLFVSAENQELLWNLIHKNPLAQQHFTQITTESKEEWFKYIIRHFYTQLQHRNISVSELQRINQDVLLFMLNSIRDKMQTMNQQPSPTTPMQSHTNILRKDTSNTIQDAFATREQEYSRLLEKTPPKEVNFADALEEPVISNMDELVKAHIQKREHELRAYAPPPVHQPIRIDKSQENISIQVDELNGGDAGSQRYKKNVSWSSSNQEIAPEPTVSIQEFESLKQYINVLTERITMLETKLNEVSQKPVGEDLQTNALTEENT